MTRSFSTSSGPAAFLSYAHRDEGDAIGKLRAALETEVRRATGEPEFTIFWDRDMRCGEQWRRRLDAGLATSTFFLPFVTPSFFGSEECCRELREFVSYDGREDADDRILPIYWRDAWQMNGVHGVDEVGTLLRRFNYVDWRPILLETPRARATRAAIHQLANRLRDVIDPRHTVPPSFSRSWSALDRSSPPAIPLETIQTPLRIVLAIDTSATMNGEKSGMIDHAVRELLPLLRDKARENPHTPVTVEVLTFGAEVSWGTRGRVPVRWFDWPGSRVDTRPGCCLDKALQILGASLGDMPGVAPRPTVVLILGSSSTRDATPDLDRFLRQPWVRRSVRLGCFVGEAADHAVLSRFIDHPEVVPLAITELGEVVDYLRFEEIDVETEGDVW